MRCAFLKHRCWHTASVLCLKQKPSRFVNERSESLPRWKSEPIFLFFKCNISSGRSVAWLARLVRDQEVGGSNPPAPTMFSVYILQSKKTSRFYTGSTQDLPNRINEHNSGENNSTRAGIPSKVLHVETFTNRSDAERKERQITARGAARYLADSTLKNAG